MPSTFPRLLAIDTTTEICSIAVQNTNGEITEATHAQSSHHSQAILPLIEGILAQAQLTLNQLNFIAVTTGPGSFTGVRAGIATVQGLAYALNISVIPFGSLELVALGMPHTSSIQVIMDARMQQYYVGSFFWEDNKLISAQAPALYSETELFGHLIISDAKSALIGTGVPLLQDKLQMQFPDLALNLNGELNIPRAKNLIEYINLLGKNTNLRGLAISPLDLAPVYVRDQVAHTKKSQ